MHSHSAKVKAQNQTWSSVSPKFCNKFITFCRLANRHRRWVWTSCACFMIIEVNFVIFRIAKASFWLIIPRVLTDPSKSLEFSSILLTFGSSHVARTSIRSFHTFIMRYFSNKDILYTLKCQHILFSELFAFFPILSKNLFGLLHFYASQPKFNTWTIFLLDTKYFNAKLVQFAFNCKNCYFPQIINYLYIHRLLLRKVLQLGIPLRFLFSLEEQ